MSNLGLFEWLRKASGFPQVWYEIETPEGDKVVIHEGCVRREDVGTVYRQYRRLLIDVEV